MLPRHRRSRTTILGLLAALAWVWSVVLFPVPAGAEQRELERGTVYTAPPVAANVQSLRLQGDAVPHHGAGHSWPTGIAATEPWLRGASLDTRSLETNRPVPVARHLVSPHDATAPPAA